MLPDDVVEEAFAHPVNPVSIPHLQRTADEVGVLVEGEAEHGVVAEEVAHGQYDAAGSGGAGGLIKYELHQTPQEAIKVKVVNDVVNP